ncbi:hypothetical protein ZIOFF_004645 [Zingiber officinale]|uniref:BED-type domain-containing protein n=1 Tax=Zingiber officinale TaxID=94328 RepID=A0A8J5HLG4_ZINOF|nr:hypothetical protein ZIOFF_004645 [Zingiber officinale]
MPRPPDIGWQYGTMIGGHRHHVKCNYCHRIMIGGITRFKKHLASKKGEIKGCEAVPKEVREIIAHHLATRKPRRPNKRRRKTDEGTSGVPTSTNYSVESDASDPDMIDARHELLTFNDVEIHSQKMMDQQFEVETRGFFDTFGNNQYKEQDFPSRATDLGWAHGLMVNGDRQKIQCKYCHKVILGGGISRLKQHLAGERGNIAPCDQVPDDVKAQMQQHLSFKGLEQTAEEYNGDDPNVTSTSSIVASHRRRGKDVNEGISNKRKKVEMLHMTQGSTLPQPMIPVSFASQENIDQADMAVAKFMFEAGIPLTAVNSMYFQKMADAIAVVGPGYKIPSCHSLRIKLLVKDSIQQMFTCNAWEESLLSKQRLGMDVKDIVFDLQFWYSCGRILKVSEPLIRVLHIAESGERPPMGYIFDAFEKAKQDIILAFENQESDYFPYLEVINHLREEFHSPLHSAACYLNPSVFYSSRFSITNVVQKGLLDCIETLEPDLTAQDNITKHKSFYEDAIGDFSRPMALRGRESLSPATWWSMYASDYPDLQRFAVRILSQTCSMTTFRRRSYANQCIYLSKNRIEHSRSNDLNFVHHNLHLQQRQTVAADNKGLVDGEYDQISISDYDAGDWIDDPGMVEAEGFNLLDVPPDGSFAVIDKVGGLYCTEGFALLFFSCYLSAQRGLAAAAAGSSLCLFSISLSLSGLATSTPRSSGETNSPLRILPPLPLTDEL